MARGKSGRIVLLVDPALKRELYKTLAGEELTLKDWFIAAAQSFIASRTQGSLFEADERAAKKS